MGHGSGGKGSGTPLVMVKCLEVDSGSCNRGSMCGSSVKVSCGGVENTLIVSVIFFLMTAANKEG